MTDYLTLDNGIKLGAGQGLSSLALTWTVWTSPDFSWPLFCRRCCQLSFSKTKPREHRSQPPSRELERREHLLSAFHLAGFRGRQLRCLTWKQQLNVLLRVSGRNHGKFNSASFRYPEWKGEKKIKNQSRITSSRKHCKHEGKSLQALSTVTVIFHKEWRWLKIKMDTKRRIPVGFPPLTQLADVALLLFHRWGRQAGLECAELPWTRSATAIKLAWVRYSTSGSVFQKQ